MPPPSTLDALHPLRGDGEITFLPGPHVYLVDGRPVRKSVTGMLKPYWPEFNGAATVDKYLPRWRQDEKSQYHGLIKYVALVHGGDDELCKAAILRLWDAQRNAAAEAGTAMHSDFQSIVEGWPLGHDETHETKAFRRWLAQFCRAQDCEPFRAEWLVVLQRGGVPIVAGQVDLVLKIKGREEYIGVDYKRSNPKVFQGRPQNLLSANQRAFAGECGTGPFEGIEATDFHKYSAQLNAYSRVAVDGYGIDFRDRMLLLQIHPDLPEAHCVRVPRMDREMDALFELEASRACLELASEF
tara:strand:- start:45 stop:938 length:894 start_codon:yes stop_codon:yes gene_type:complete